MLVCYGSSVNSLIRRVCAHGVLFIYRHIYRLCLNIPLWRFCFRDSIPSKWKALKFYNAIRPAFSRHRVNFTAAECKLNAFKQLPVVALLRQFERVLFQLICYCFSAIPRSVFTVTYNESVNFIAQHIPIGRSNFLNIIRSGLQVCKQRLAVFAGRLDNNLWISGSSSILILIQPEHRALQRLIFASCLGYAYAALCSRVFPCQDNALSIKLEVIRNCPLDVRRTVGLYIYSYAFFQLAISGGRLCFDYCIRPLCKPFECRYTIRSCGFPGSSG